MDLQPIIGKAPAPPTQNRGVRVVSVASGKGGAGKTVAAVNLAAALAGLGRKVCLLDADLGMSNVDVVLGMAPKHTLEHVLFDGVPVKDAVIPVGENLDIVSGGHGVLRMAELTRKDRRRLINEFNGLTGYDYLIVDNSPGISNHVLSFCLSSREIVLVVNPEASSVADAYGLVKVLRENGLWFSPLLLINKSVGKRRAKLVYEKFSLAAKRFLDLDIGLLGVIPEDQAFRRSATLRKPLLHIDPGAQAAVALRAAARQLDQAVTRRKRAALAPGAFLDSSVVKLKLGFGGLSKPRPQRSQPATLREATSRLDDIETTVGKLHAACSEADKNRLLLRFKEELYDLRRLLAGEQSVSVGRSAPPASRKQVVELGGRTVASAVTEFVSDDPPPFYARVSIAPKEYAERVEYAERGEYVERVEYDGRGAVDSVVEQRHRLPEPTLRKGDEVVVVGDNEALVDILSEVARDAGLKPRKTGPLRPVPVNGDTPPGLGIVCWDGPEDNLRDILGRFNGTPVVLLRSWFDPAGKSELPGRVVEVMSKPFRIEKLSELMRRLSS